MVNIAPTLFSELEPRASIIDVNGGLEAHLVAGPFKDQASAQRRCNQIRQRIITPCSPVTFAGRVLNRN